MATTFAGLLFQPITVGLIPEAPVFSLDAPTGTVRGFVVPLTAAFGGVFEATRESVRDTAVTTAGYVEPGVGRSWFEHVHSVPQFLELGNIVTTLLREIEFYNAYRRQTRELQLVTNTVGSGTEFVGLPALPYEVAAQHSLIVTFRVSTAGPPLLEGTLTFEFDTETLALPVTGTRVVMFPYLPESPLIEMLEFRTTVLTSINGKEQRICERKNPRQSFEMTILLEDVRLRRQLQSLLFGWQPGVFGVPVWFEARPLAVNATAGDTVIQVDTLYGDFRDGSLAIIWSDEVTFDALEVASHTDTSITFSSPLTQDFDANTSLVMPLRTAITDSSVAVQRKLVNLEAATLLFRVLDNDANLADTTAFPSYAGKVLLNEPNMVNGETLPAGFERQLVRLDNGSAAIAQFSDWTAPNLITEKGFLCTTPQRRWEIRQLLHALRGSQVTFYLPTFYHDMVVANDLSSGSDLMDIENIDYTRYINAQSPGNVLLVELNDGTQLYKTILSSEVIDVNTERLTLSTVWASTIFAVDVARVSYLRLARISGNSVTFEHRNTGESMVFVPVTEVQQ